MSDKEKQYAVIGDPIGHSKSPKMQNAAFRNAGLRANYIAVRVEKQDLEAFVREARKNLAGFNITVPHKNNIIPFLDKVEKSAALAGSVNTVTVNPDGTLSGCSTDGYGLECAVQEAGGPALRDSVICFIGCGGVVPALAYHAAEAGAKEIRILNRSGEKAEALSAALRNHYPSLQTAGASLDNAGDFLKGADLTLQCTSVGLRDDDPSPVDPALLDRKTFLFDLIYKETAILQYAEANGIRGAGGLGMLIHQGAKSFEIWTGIKPSVDVMRDAIAD